MVILCNLALLPLDMYMHGCHIPLFSQAFADIRQISPVGTGTFGRFPQLSQTIILHLEGRKDIYSSLAAD